MSDNVPWQMSLVGMEAGVFTLTVAWNASDFNSTALSQFRQLLHDRWSHISTDAKDLRPLFAGKQMEDRLANGREATLKDYDIQCASAIQMVFRLSGELEQNLSRRQFIERVPTPPDVENVFQLPGGQDQPRRQCMERVAKPPEVEKVLDLSDPTLKFTTEHDTILGFSEDDDQLRIRMSC